jgi:hypothetical protein
VWIITTLPITKRRANLLVNEFQRLNIQQVLVELLPLETNNFMDFVWPIRFNAANDAFLAREADEEACICNSLDLNACLGTNEIVAQECHRACRQLRADRSDRGRQTGLLHEVRQFASAAVPATAG